MQGSAPAARRWRPAVVIPFLLVALLLGGLLIGGLLRTPRPGPHDPLRLLAGQEGPVVAELGGRLLADVMPGTFAGGAPGSEQGGASPPCRVLLEVRRAGGLAGLEGRTELLLPRCERLQEGWIVRAEGRLLQPRAAPHPLLSGPAERLARQGAWTRLRVERLQVLQRPPTPIADLRRRIAGRFIAVAGAERGGLLAALVLGSAVVPLPPELRDAFRASGLSHALAASGFHLTVLLGAVLPLGRRLGGPARLGLAAAAIGLFLLLAGPQPSVVRAVVMGAIALLVLESGLRSRPLGLLGLTVFLMLLLRPDWLQDVGFQLSVAATAGLVITAGPLEEALQPWLPGWLRPAWSAPALAVPLAATLWTLPLQLLHFGAVPLWAVPANVAAAPLLTPLTLGAMALALVAVLTPPLLPPLAAPIAWLAGLLQQVAQGFASLPMAQWQTGRPMPWLVLLLAVAQLGWLLPGLGWRPRRLATALFALAVALHLAVLGADQLLLVHQEGGGGGRDLLLARHRGRAALISTGADGASCRQARQLAHGLGVARFDWVLLLDPVAAAEPTCWAQQAGRLVAEGEDAAPLLAGQRLASPGLAVQALSMDSHALALRLGRRDWLLLPDRQAWLAWQASRRSAPQRLWLGFPPGPQERRVLQALAPRQLWLSGAAPARPPLPRGWSASGASGSLGTGGA